MINKVIWCDRGWMPYHFGFCPNEAAWKFEMKRMKLAEPPDYPLQDGRCTSFVQRKGLNACDIVTITDDRKASSAMIISMLFHEGVHVWQHMRETIGEEAPSSEFEAYQIQSIGLNLIKAYEKSGRGRLTSGRIAE